MANKIALITGISGQDGSYLTELLIDKGYTVHGIVRRNSIPEHQKSRLENLSKEVTVHYGDLMDGVSLNYLLDSIQPEEIYNLAAQSHVRISFEIPEFTANVNALGTLRLLNIVKQSNANCKFYQASSSEMFGTSVDKDLFQRESTPMNPVSPYGCAKLFAYHTTRNFRNSHELFACNGILFNHESPRRGSNFVTTKVIKTAVQIKYGFKQELILGNLDAERDWGHSRDYVRAMHMIMQHSRADDWVVATGQTRSIRNLLEIVFDLLDLRYQDYVKQDSRYFRSEEVPFLRGDFTKINRELGWNPEISFEELIEEMVKFWVDQINV
jgi:GDPmannose 4,6-dehydratase